MGVIYETINIHNKNNGIYPWRYIGSDHYNNPEYLGSSEQLNADIELYGRENFVKNILLEVDTPDNKELRKIEADKYLKPLNVKKDPSYYNKTDIYGAGGGKPGMKHCKKFARTKNWIESRTGYKPSRQTRELWSSQRIGKKHSSMTRKKMSDARSGENNHNALAWTVTAPDGNTYEVTALRTWTRENNYNFYEIYNNKNGWTCVKHGQGKGGRRKKKEVLNGY